MNIADAHNTSSQANNNYINEVEKISPAEQEYTTELAKITDSAAFSSVLPSLLTAFEHIAKPGQNVLEILNDNIERLQNGFIDALYTVLHAHNIDLSKKLTLYLDAQMCLKVAEQRVDKEYIEAVLAQHTEITEAFAQLASQSAALKDLYSLQNMVLLGTEGDTAVHLKPSNKKSHYQISIKGDMNHFYFSKTTA